ncbi:MAG: hypothetical protein WHS44_09275 [Fimbriimonadales bacterium]|nr:MAG: hypothetical protein KatS3mg018_1173 [Fimbriimonadales bacterium]
MAERVGAEWRVRYRAVVPTEQLQATLQMVLNEHTPDRLLVGAGTGSKRLLEQLRAWFPQRRWEPVAERETTLRARELYFQYHPPRGWRRLLPKGMRIPPEPYDDYAALALIFQHAETP